MTEQKITSLGGSISEQSQSALLDEGESSSLVSSMASLPAVGSFGSFAECIPGCFLQELLLVW